jgi:DNA-binding NarL/FixJ family response regulator
MKQVRVAVRTDDPITTAGLVNYVQSRPGLTVAGDLASGQADVVVAAFDRLSTNAVATLRELAEYERPIVLVINEIKEVELFTAVECRVVAIVPRAATTNERLATSIQAAAAEGADIPPDLLGRLLEQAEWLHREVLAPNGLTASSLSEREISVLRLIADGLDTGQIARNLSYSERTVKNVISALTSRLHLRNRSHAVAYALRAGVI